MHFDLLTLYFLAIGTLLLSAALTLWDGQARPQRIREMNVLAAGYCTLAMGCVLAVLRGQLPGALGNALSNSAMLAGYLLVLEGVCVLATRSRRVLAMAILAGNALAWVIGGSAWKDALWNHISAMPIAMVCALTAWELMRNDQLRSLRSRRIPIALTAIHSLFYAGRAVILPMVANAWGPDAITIAGKATMYEGVLYSVGLPMALLALIREEADAQLLSAYRTDYLTGLSNRRWFFEEGERLIAAAEPTEAIALLAFDLDHFKTINDRHGHATGDHVLCHFAQIVASLAGPRAIAARLGGEEFAALLPGCDRPQAVALGQKIASRLAAVIVHDPHGVEVRATVSIGLAALGCDGDLLGDLLGAADRGLYRAKALGRNRIESAPPPISAAA